MTPQARQNLWDLGLESIKELETDRGILASARTEAYGCIFGRDSLITSLKLLRAYEKTGSKYFLELVKKILINLAELQGKTVNIESGEEPGKMIHEYRPTDHEHLTKALNNPWYVYPDGSMRNYDSVDSTPLFLMAVHAYYRASGEETFVHEILPAINAALEWIEKYGDTNHDGFIDYQFDPKRVYGGLRSQSWMDSAESVFFEHNNETPQYPIAPVEAQGYTYAALRAWADYFETRDKERSRALLERAENLKKLFNEQFVLRSKGLSLAFAIDGRGKQLTSPRSSMGHCLFAAYKPEQAPAECIVDYQLIPLIVKRLMSPDLYVKNAGIRTLSRNSRHFAPQSYHNGSIWPHDTTIIAAGFENFEFIDEATRVRNSILKAYSHFETPIELFVYAQHKFGEYLGPHGQGASRRQAWSAASLLTMLGGSQ